jgi:NAD(P)-dependent dehydrogenase (short-subunit alcohol dehydrogenase family)
MVQSTVETFGGLDIVVINAGMEGIEGTSKTVIAKLGV